MVVLTYISLMDNNAKHVLIGHLDIIFHEMLLQVFKKNIYIYMNFVGVEVHASFFSVLVHN